MAQPDETPSEPKDWLDREDEVLAPYAVHTRQGRGRRYEESPHPFRALYQRDRDRIVHCTAFRRLMHKTQVLVTQTNDHHRTRLTHTLEVTQIARTVARYLGLNEDLTEAIALSHDLGHPPFGHAGEEALDHCMREHGGFEHNKHALRIVEVLEYGYPAFPGLNLSWEVREAMAQHSRLRHSVELAPYTEIGQPTLEAQVADACDSLAYDAHDVDDALSVGLITTEDLREVDFWRQALESALQRYGNLGSEQFQPTLVRTLIDLQVRDLLEQTQRALRRERISSLDDVRRYPGKLVAPGSEVSTLKSHLEAFLHQRVYWHYRVQRMALKGKRIVDQLYQAFCDAPQTLPDRYQRRVEAMGLERTVCDYIAGMTDRYAQDEYLRLFQP